MTNLKVRIRIKYIFMRNNNFIEKIEVKIMLIIILTAWLIGIALILIFFKGATKKEKEI
ncbi:MAG: hypothetical protein MR510_01325 [Clostridium sp.]|uniref:hypothetical protein n=1 Tax=Clostridium sp. TaxID=1506 RepID=UPI002A760F3F|nr:hypothetical protein [Clostridium sp.]MCI6691120.1 hypothetical protein [Clostridium sp.]MDY2632477.1 hypothetical protein [Clostridium sp.]